MASFTGTDGGIVKAAHDEHGVYVRAPYKAAHLPAAAARELAADLLALADQADEWVNAARD